MASMPVLRKILNYFLISLNKIIFDYLLNNDWSQLLLFWQKEPLNLFNDQLIAIILMPLK